MFLSIAIAAISRQQTKQCPGAKALLHRYCLVTGRRRGRVGRHGTRMYREFLVVSSYARQQENRSNGYHGYHSTEPQGVSLSFVGYHMVPIGTTNAALVGLDSIWTPEKASVRRSIRAKNTHKSMKVWTLKGGGQGRNRYTYGGSFHVSYCFFVAPDTLERRYQQISGTKLAHFSQPMSCLDSKPIKRFFVPN